MHYSASMPTAMIFCSLSESIFGDSGAESVWIFFFLLQGEGEEEAEGE